MADQKDLAVPRVNYREAVEPRPPLTGAARLRQWFIERPQLPYLLPFFGFVALMGPAAFGTLGGIDWAQLWLREQPVIYTAKTLVGALLLWLFWRYYTPIRWRHLGLGVLAGLFGTLLWIATEYACQALGFSHPPSPATLYIPDLMLHATWQRWLFLCIRVVGPTLVVPVMEELFFRDFIMRLLVRGAHFEDVPVGTFTWFSLIGMSLLFGLNHGMPPSGAFFAGVLYGLLMGLLLIRTKSLGSCIVAHAITNWTLYLYVIYRGDWQFM